MRFLGTMPNAEELENLAYRVIVVGFVFWTSVWLALVGMSAVAFNYTIANPFFKGLHAHSGL